MRRETRDELKEIFWLVIYRIRRYRRAKVSVAADVTEVIVLSWLMLGLVAIVGQNRPVAHGMIVIALTAGYVFFMALLSRALPYPPEDVENAENAKSGRSGDEEVTR